MLKQKIKQIIGLVVVLFIVSQSFPQPALALALNDLNLQIKGFFQFEVEKSDRFLQTANTKVDQSLQIFLWCVINNQCPERD